jgi:hypothetical protein
MKWKYTNMNAFAPTIKGLIKIHKSDMPIRPVVNWRNAPAYKLSRFLTSKINHFSPLSYSFNVKNSAALITDLQHTPITPTSRIASLDIKNMYPNIPTSETRQILQNILTANNTEHTLSTEILHCYDTITTQNYFTHNDQILTQTDGLAMGAPSSSIISEIFLQHMEHTHLPSITLKYNLLNYHRYVDDILIVYDIEHTDIHSILNDFNSIHTKLPFTQETETHNAISYLDITIFRSPHSVNIGIYSKPTFTDSIIPFTSNHPIQHKYAAIKFLHNRLNSYTLQGAEYTKEENIIQNILHNNAFPATTHRTHTQHTTTSPHTTAPFPQTPTKDGPPSPTMARNPTSLRKFSNTPPSK